MGDTVTSGEEAAPASNAARLDSLRRRAAALRADLLRLRVEFGVRLDRIESGLRFRIPAVDGEERLPLRRVAALVRRHYPEANVAVRAPVRDGGADCGTPDERRRTRRTIERLTGPDGLDARRVEPAGCDRLPALDPRATRPAEGPPPLLLFVDWYRPGEGSG